MTSGLDAPRVFADTNVLYGGALRDILIELALAGSVELRWSAEVLDELVRALNRTRTDYSHPKAMALVAAMMEALPDALVLLPAGEPAVGLPDAGDEHVVLGAHHAECGVLLTFNVKDFPAELVAPLVVRHPDEFLLEQLASDPERVIAVVDAVRLSLKGPPLDKATYCDGLHKAGMLNTAELLRHLLSGE